ncbi:hypothetical protein NM688_g274 [Phlebia brevispora]|uniref:Uncharacterized protein n=1 Tax=Phlebia brevispora TaxID=194682 RepID=A0ACC1TEX3_9APHY|nr:hypothetical protein NM688_g274 [Phlebia brevispora]
MDFLDAILRLVFPLNHHHLRIGVANLVKLHPIPSSPTYPYYHPFRLTEHVQVVLLLRTPLPQVSAQPPTCIAFDAFATITVHGDFADTNSLRSLRVIGIHRPKTRKNIRKFGKTSLAIVLLSIRFRVAIRQVFCYFRTPPQNEHWSTASVHPCLRRPPLLAVCIVGCHALCPVLGPVRGRTIATLVGGYCTSLPSLSRATSISRGSSKAGSAVSRQQSLIKKNIAPHDLRPSDILIERFTAWKVIVKQLIAYFEGLADIENNVAREMTKLGAVIQVPFRSGNQFLGEGGLQDVFYQIRDRTRAIADQHANLGLEIKAHIKNIQNDTGKLATAVAKEREYSAKLIGDLGTNISILKNTPMSVTAKSDPYVANQIVYKQLIKQVHTENALQKSLLLTQSSSALFEASLIQAIQSAWATYEEWRSRMDGMIQETWTTLEQSMSALAPDREWIAFAAREDHLIDPETPLRDPMNIHYPSKDDPSVLLTRIRNERP